jgi:hypothetical protein
VSGKSETIKNWVEIVAVFAAGVWAVYTFVYKEFYVPTTEPPEVTLSVRAAPLAQAKGMVAATVMVSLKNQSGRSIDILAGWFKVVGFRFAPLSQPDVDCRKFAETPLNRLHRIYRCSTYVAERLEALPGTTGWYSPGEVIVVGKFVDQVQGIFLRVNEPLSYQYLVHIPRKYDYVRVEVEARIRRSSETKPRLTLKWSAAPNGTLQEHWTNEDSGYKYDPDVKPEDSKFLAEHLVKVVGLSEISLWPGSGIGETGGADRRFRSGTEKEGRK